ncbi:hypothetical protein FRAHR75_530019 [Frankia sp. Hr75.2]|nr:hypothetical protein FRAHR75_530019 [Frankia sp. Hr75.2]SQD98024.1 hypothetical protein FMEAI12_4440005 [Parafrankia sp. Ea1.12]
MRLFSRYLSCKQLDDPPAPTIGSATDDAACPGTSRAHRRVTPAPAAYPSLRFSCP